jgi:rhodanese-related sulfurtransferase
MPAQKCRVMTVLPAHVDVGRQPDGSKSLHASYWAFWALWLLAFPHHAEAADSSVYCGLYSVYGASVALGRPIEFEKLLNANYIGEPNGSSAGELVRALNDFGFTASVFSGLSIETLRSGPCPMILHVASGDQLEAYNHWVLFLGCEGDSGNIVDSVDGKQRLPLAQILTRWDGNAIFVGNEPVTAASVILPDLLLYGQYGLILLGSVLLVGRWLPDLSSINKAAIRVHPWRRCSRELAAILFIGAAAGCLFHAVDPIGFFPNPGAASFVAAAQLESFIPERSLAEVQSLARQDALVFIDARFAPDYEAGHIPGARSIPVDATRLQRTNALTGLSRHQNIVVYCQSSGCRFADLVAVGLVREGFEQVSVFPGGWVEWMGDATSSYAQQAGNEVAERKVKPD